LQETSKTSWHSLSAQKVAEIFKTDPKQGLDLSEANNRLQKFGENTLSVKKERSQLFKICLIQKIMNKDIHRIFLFCTNSLGCIEVLDY